MSWISLFHYVTESNELYHFVGCWNGVRMLSKFINSMIFIITCGMVTRAYDFMNFIIPWRANVTAFWFFHKIDKFIILFGGGDIIFKFNTREKNPSEKILNFSAREDFKLPETKFWKLPEKQIVPEKKQQNFTKEKKNIFSRQK